MRDSVHPSLERARITEGPRASTPEFGLCGAFKIPGPEGRTLIIMGYDGKADEQDEIAMWEHVSVQAVGHDRRPRIPTWREMCWVKGLFWKEDECVVQYHPAQKDYVNLHGAVLHLWRRRDGDFPMPPKECV